MFSFHNRVVFFAESKEITAESPRGGVDIKRVYGEWTTSYLLIRNANIADSGIYTCAPAGGSQTHIKVHVFLHGKYTKIIVIRFRPFGTIRKSIYIYTINFIVYHLHCSYKFSLSNSEINGLRWATRGNANWYIHIFCWQKLHLAYIASGHHHKHLQYLSGLLFKHNNWTDIIRRYHMTNQHNHRFTTKFTLNLDIILSATFNQSDTNTMKWMKTK